MCVKEDLTVDTTSLPFCVLDPESGVIQVFWGLTSRRRQAGDIVGVNSCHAQRRNSERRQDDRNQKVDEKGKGDGAPGCRERKPFGRPFSAVTSPMPAQIWRPRPIAQAELQNERSIY